MSKSPGLIPLFKIKVEEKGLIKDIKEIIVRIDGLPTCLSGQILDMGDGVRGIIMGFDEEDVLALVLGDPGRLRMGKEIKGISEPFEIPVSDAIIGRMITALGEPCDHGDPLPQDRHRPVFRNSPPITHRAPITDCLHSGTKVIDMVVPLAKGQRQLVLGDRMTGKTVVGLDAIIAQKGRDVVCIYCAVGKSVSNLTKAVNTLNEAGALEYTAIVVANDNAPVGEQYIVPYSAASVADHFVTQGRDVLVVFDDLTKHAWAYRQLSLLLERPPGREAYPGDIFYVQTQLMERAGKFNDKFGCGSATYIGIAETLQNDLTGYIPSNLASMCDGQVCMSSHLFAEGIRPAVDTSLSMTIVGGKVQPPILRHLSSSLRADFAKYHELVKLSKISSGLSGEAAKIVSKGEIIETVFHQQEFMPSRMHEQMLLLHAVDTDVLMDKSKEERLSFCNEVYPYAKDHHSDILDKLGEHTKYSEEVSDQLTMIVNGYLENAASQPVESVPEAEVES